ncbi:hypothetical protein D3C71_1103010 [compost metagenome]
MFGETAAQGAAAHVQVAGDFLDVAALGQVPGNRPFHRLDQIHFPVHLRGFQFEQFHGLAQGQGMVIGQLNAQPMRIDHHAVLQAAETHVRPQQARIFAEIVRRGMHELHGRRLEIRPDQRPAVHQQAGEKLLDREQLHVGERQAAFNVDKHPIPRLLHTRHDNAARGVLMANAQFEGIAQGLAQRQHMPQQPQRAEHILRADPQAQPLIGQGLERALNHGHGLAMGNTLRRVLQVFKGKAQPSAQALGVDAFLLGDFGQGLQEKRRHQRQFKGGIDHFHLHGAIHSGSSCILIFVTGYVEGS